MPAPYQCFLERLSTYQPPSCLMPRIGAALFLALWLPIMRAMERLTKQSLKDRRTGTAPDWVVVVVRIVVITMWLHHDVVHAPIWGRGDGMTVFH